MTAKQMNTAATLNVTFSGQSSSLHRAPMIADANASIEMFAEEYLRVCQGHFADAGDLAGALRGLLSRVVQLLRRAEVERIVRAAAALDGRNDGSVEARTSFWSSKFAGSARIAEQAIEREFPADTDPALLVEFLVAPTYLRLLMLDGPLDDELIDQSVRRTIAAFAELC